MTQPGPDVPPVQPEPPAAAWAPPEGPPVGPGPLPQAPRRKIEPKWLRVGLVAAVAVAFGVVRLTGAFGGGEPGVGDCVKAKGSTSFEIVDCTSADAQAKIVGKSKAELTSKEFQGADELCPEFPDADVELWTGDDTEKGTVYCARSLQPASSNR